MSLVRSSSVLIIASIISTDEDPSLRIESSTIINLRGVSTKLNWYCIHPANVQEIVNLVLSCMINFSFRGAS